MRRTGRWSFHDALPDTRVRRIDHRALHAGERGAPWWQGARAGPEGHLRPHRRPPEALAPTSGRPCARCGRGADVGRRSAAVARRDTRVGCTTAGRGTAARDAPGVACPEPAGVRPTPPSEQPVAPVRPVAPKAPVPAPVASGRPACRNERAVAVAVVGPKPPRVRRSATASPRSCASAGISGSRRTCSPSPAASSSCSAPRSSSPSRSATAG